MVDQVTSRNLMKEGPHENLLTGADEDLDWNSKLHPRHQSQQGMNMDKTVQTRLKDYLGFETSRNKTHAATYERFLRAALPGVTLSVLVGHHICLEVNGDLSTENEIPSADCLLFDHDLMKAVFKHEASGFMEVLAKLPCGDRDAKLLYFMDLVGVPK